MAIEQKERYIVKLRDGNRINANVSSFLEVLQLYGEENVEMIEKLDYEEIKNETA